MEDKSRDKYDDSNLNMTPDSIDILLMGFSRSGKSATGNTILGCDAFKRNMGTSKQSCQLLKKECLYMEKTISVVDGLSIGNDGLDVKDDVVKDSISLQEAVGICGNGFSALLIVLKFGVGLEQEVMHMIQVAKAALGESVIRDFGICVISYKDNFEHSKEENEISDLDDWCKKQGPEMEKFFDEINRRCILLNNRTKDPLEMEKQRMELVGCILDLSRQGNKRYTLNNGRMDDILKTRISEFGQDVLGKLNKMQQLISDIKRQPEPLDFVTLSKQLKDLAELVSLTKDWIPQIEDLRQEISAKLNGKAYKVCIDPNPAAERMETSTSYELSTKGVFPRSQAPHEETFKETMQGNIVADKAHSLLATYGDNGAKQENTFLENPPKSSSDYVQFPEDMEFSGENKNEQVHDLNSRIQVIREAAIAHAEHSNAKKDHEMFPSGSTLMGDGKLKNRLNLKQAHENMDICESHEVPVLVSGGDAFLEEKARGIKIRMREAEESFHKSQAKYKSELESFCTELQNLQQNSRKEMGADSASGVLKEVEAIIHKLQSELSFWDKHSPHGHVDFLEPLQEKGVDVQTCLPSSNDNESKVTSSMTEGQTIQSTPTTTFLLLIGRTGNGRSATGNAITGKRTFKRNASTTCEAETTKPNESIAFATIGDHRIGVIDGPGINDSANTKDVETLIASLKKSLEVCNYAFSALLIVLKFGERFTKQETEAMKAIKKLLGNNVIKEYGICVVTHGDNFDSAAEEAEENGEPPMTFEGWCKNQSGDAADLFEECGFRCVLFDNVTKDAAKRSEQFRKLISFVEQNSKYSREKYLMAEEGKHQLLFESRLPELEQETEKLIDEIRDEMSKATNDKAGDLQTQKRTLGKLLDKLSKHQEYLQNIAHNSPSFKKLEWMMKTLEGEIVSKIRRICMEEQIAEEAAQAEVQVSMSHQHVPILGQISQDTKPAVTSSFDGKEMEQYLLDAINSN